MKRFCVVLLFICIFVVTGLGQSNTGSLTGTVADASGVIPNATVTITDNRTGREKTTQSSGEGTFNFTLLDVGLYTVKVSAPGHKTYTATDVKIDVGAQYSLNPTLEVGSLCESVTVVAGAEAPDAPQEIEVHVRVEIPRSG